MLAEVRHVVDSAAFDTALRVRNPSTRAVTIAILGLWSLLLPYDMAEASCH